MVKLVDQNVDISSVLYPLCDVYMEDSHHVFVLCEVPSEVWRRVFMWIDLPFPLFSNVADLCNWVDSVIMNSAKRKVLEVIVLTAILMYQNGVFQTIWMKRSFIFYNIVLHSFDWFSNISSRSSIMWTLWLQNPMLQNSL